VRKLCFGLLWFCFAQSKSPSYSVAKNAVFSANPILFRAFITDWEEPRFAGFMATRLLFYVLFATAAN